MRTGFQQKLSEEIELEQKRGELSSLRARHGQARALLQRLLDDIERFEREYEKNLGWRVAELERLEEEIARLSGRPAGKRRGGGGHSGAGDTFRQQAKPGWEERGWQSEPQDIKSLYREVAKAIHPDLVGAGPAKAVRNELMSKANRAYAADDRRTLLEILRAWRKAHPEAREREEGGELGRLDALIARERRDLRAVNGRIEELEKSYACRLKLGGDWEGGGSGLFAEMVAAVDLNIARAEERLAALEREFQEDERREPARQRQKERRKLVFPSAVSCGTLFIRDRGSLNYSHWKEFGPARGALEVETDKAVRLDISERVGGTLGQLQGLKPYDLQSLFLYGACDADLEKVVHLTGLEELYLSGMRLTDAALAPIATLGNLRRIYIYQTGISDQGLRHLHLLPSLTGLTSSGNSITEAGLARFQRSIPRVRTRSFQWKK